MMRQMQRAGPGYGLSYTGGICHAHHSLLASSRQKIAVFKAESRQMWKNWQNWRPHIGIRKLFQNRISGQTVAQDCGWKIAPRAVMVCIFPLLQEIRPCARLLQPRLFLP
jgi:hypothetical protein